MAVCLTCKRRNECDHKWKYDEFMVGCTGYIKSRTNFERVTESPEALAEFIDQVATECYVCGRNRMNMECQKEPCSTKVRYCEREFIDWLNEENKE